MDYNGTQNRTAQIGYPISVLPVGFGMALAMNEEAMLRYADLTEDEREDIILKCRDASSKEEMQKIVNSLVPEQDVHSLYEDMKKL